MACCSEIFQIFLFNLNVDQLDDNLIEFMAIMGINCFDELLNLP